MAVFFGSQPAAGHLFEYSGSHLSEYLDWNNRCPANSSTHQHAIHEIDIASPQTHADLPKEFLAVTGAHYVRGPSAGP